MTSGSLAPCAARPFAAERYRNARVSSVYF
jgi:hypothetical protein